uniref:Sulfotransferase domain-containing protein n=1 Tax=Plectus sambesii TaxID=2011161 RepID=A0A914VFA4_9BILA
MASSERERLEKLRQVAAIDPYPQRFQPKSDEVFISTYCKAGTTWTQQIVHQLRTGGHMDFDEIHEVIPYLPFGDIEPQIPLDTPQPADPRCYKSHDTWETVPKGCKYIYVARDPVDNFYSLYLHTHDVLALEEGVTTDDFYFEGYESHVRTVWNHQLSWWKQRNNPDVLFLFYEDYKEDFDGSLKRIADFLNIKLNEEKERVVKEYCSFAFMKQHWAKFNGHLQRSHESQTWHSPTEEVPIKYGKVRNGQGGQGRQLLSPEVVASIEDHWRAAFKDYGFERYADMRKASIESRVQ